MCWLGRSDPDAEKAFLLYESLSRVRRIRSDTIGIKQALQLPPTDPLLMEGLLEFFRDDEVSKNCLLEKDNATGETRIKIECWKAIKVMSDRSWFHRLWIVQEFVLTKNVEIRCGAQSMSLDAIALVGLSLLSGFLSGSTKLKEIDRDEFPHIGLLKLWHLRETLLIRDSDNPTDRREYLYELLQHLMSTSTSVFSDQ